MELRIVVLVASSRTLCFVALLWFCLTGASFLARRFLILLSYRQLRQVARRNSILLHCKLGFLHWNLSALQKLWESRRAPRRAWDRTRCL